VSQMLSRMVAVGADPDQLKAWRATGLPRLYSHSVAALSPPVYGFQGQHILDRVSPMGLLSPGLPSPHVDALT
jgi:hypothetical protein